MNRKVTSPLEHLILEALQKVMVIITAAGSNHAGHNPIYERQIGTAHLAFAVLVDMINNPLKYNGKPLGMLSWNQLSLKREAVTITRYDWQEVADAIDELVSNGHVTNELSGYIAADRNATRTITLTEAGERAFRNNHYIKEAAKELSVSTQHEIQRRDLWMKKNFWAIELLKPAASKAVIIIATALVTYLITKFL